MSSTRSSNEGKGRKRQSKETRKAAEKHFALPEPRKSGKKLNDVPVSRKSTEKIVEAPEPRKVSGKVSDSKNESRKSGKVVEVPESRKSVGKSSESTESPRKSTGKTNDLPETRKSSEKNDRDSKKSLGKADDSPDSEPLQKASSKYQRGSNSVKPKREVEQIFGITDQRGELEFSIKFKSEDTVELIPTKIANVEYPQEVIKFYQERLVWKPVNCS